MLADVFLRDLDLPPPDIDLGVGSGTHADQTGNLLLGLGPVLEAWRPSLVVVYGDVNSTLAAALAAVKLRIPVAHVEAGLRSFDDSMPEEINRRLTDQLSDLLFVTSPEGVGHLEDAGIARSKIHFVGNPMIDPLLARLDRLDPARVRAGLDLPDRYAVATLHRPDNVDEPRSAERMVRMLQDASVVVPLVVPLHPRGRPALEAAGLASTERLRVIEPLGYDDFLSLIRGAVAVITDSGGVQEETTVLGIRCLTVRPNTERPITITHGTNELVEPDAVPARLATAMGPGPRATRGVPLWDGHAGERIAEIVSVWLAAVPVR